MTGRAGRLGSLVAAALLAFSCGSESGESTGGETHFLTHCDASSDSCGDQLSCLCGVCTLPCSERAACQAFPPAECVPPRQGEACTDSQAPGQCDVPCVADADCAVLSSSHRCEQGACRAAAPAPNGSGGVSNAGGAAGASGASVCAHGEVSANQVLLIGDSFLAASHQITAYLEDDARNAGVLPPGERYRDNSNLTSNGLAFGGNGIAGQYDAAISEAAVKVVIMNGGGADILLGSCDTADANCPVLVAAAAAAETLLAKMAEDGVQHVVYVFYADPVEADLRAKMDALRPLIQGVCEGSPVPCDWLDLRPAFAGHYAEYIQPDGRDPTAVGSQASAAAIWATMQRSCIAQ